MIPVVYIKLQKMMRYQKQEKRLKKLEYIQASILDSNDFSDKFIIDAHGKWQNRDFETDEYGYLPIYRFELINTSKRVIPKKLNYIGNFPDLTPPDKEFVMEIKENICPVYWKNVEENILEKYFLYNKKENVIYQNTMGTGSASFFDAALLKFTRPQTMWSFLHIRSI